jgi:hypothetical protein
MFRALTIGCDISACTRYRAIGEMAARGALDYSRLLRGVQTKDALIDCGLRRVTLDVSAQG